MFRILITSAVYMWHFVYLTVLLFFCYFSSMVAITGWMVHSLLQEANDRAMRLWDGGKEKEEESCCPSDRQRWRWTRKLSSPVCGGRSLTRTSACPFHPPLSGWRRWWDGCRLDGVVGWLDISFLTLPLMIQVVQHHPSSSHRWRWGRKCLCFHKATQTKASWVAQRSGLPTHHDGKSHNYLWLYQGGGRRG